LEKRAALVASSGKLIMIWSYPSTSGPIPLEEKDESIVKFWKITLGEFRMQAVLMAGIRCPLRVWAGGRAEPFLTDWYPYSLTPA
jgi:hypothetical protein